MTKSYITGGLYGLVIVIASAGGGMLAERMVIKSNPPVSPLDLPEQLATQSGCADYNVLTIVSSLRQHPDQWSSDDYRLYRDNWGSSGDIYIWIANADYGLDFAKSEFTASSVHYPFTDQCRALLYKTTQAWQKYDWNRRLK